MDVSYYIKEKLKIKVAKWGTPKKNILKKSYSMLNALALESFNIIFQ
jgi:hypothetical protein